MRELRRQFRVSILRLKKRPSVLWPLGVIGLHAAFALFAALITITTN